MPQSTKGQIEMGETIAVIIVFLVLLTFGLLWYTQFSKAGDAKGEDDLSRLELLEKTKEVMNMPELQCSTAGKADSTCLDLYKIRAVQTKVGAENDLYKYLSDRFYGFSIEVQMLYPPSVDKNPGEVFSFLADETAPTGQRKTVIPVIVYDAMSEKNYFSVLILTQYTFPSVTDAAGVKSLA